MLRRRCWRVVAGLTLSRHACMGTSLLAVYTSSLWMLLVASLWFFVRQVSDELRHWLATIMVLCLSVGWIILVMRRVWLVVKTSVLACGVTLALLVLVVLFGLCSSSRCKSLFNVALFGLCAIMILWFVVLKQLCRCLIRAAPFMLLMFLKETNNLATLIFPFIAHVTVVRDVVRLLLWWS